MTRYHRRLVGCFSPMKTLSSVIEIALPSLHLDAPSTIQVEDSVSESWVGEITSAVLCPLVDSLEYRLHHALWVQYLQRGPKRECHSSRLCWRSLVSSCIPPSLR